MPRDERPLEADLTTASVPAVVQDGSLELLGLLPNSSNGTFLARVSSPDGEEALVVYKPLRGESPLWDFPEGSLGRREVAASLDGVAASVRIVNRSPERAGKSRIKRPGGRVDGWNGELEPLAGWLTAALALFVAALWLLVLPRASLAVPGFRTREVGIEMALS